MANDKPALVVGVADWHTNSTVGLNPISLRRELGSQHVAGKIGRATWRSWLAFWRVVEEKRAQYQATVFTFAVGDLGDKNSHSNIQLITASKVEIQDAMAEVAEPMAQASDYVFILRGTESHVGPNGEMEEWLARDLDNAVPYSEGVASWWVANVEIAGKKFMVTHHPPTVSRRPWTLRAAVSRSASIVAGQHLDAGDTRNKPDVCMWAHAHTRGALAYGMGDTTGIFLPPWQLHTGFAHRIGAGSAPRCVGGFWMVVRDGKVLEWEFERWWPQREKLWSAP